MNTPLSLVTENGIMRSKGARKRNPWRWFWVMFLILSLSYAWYCFYVPANGIAWAGNYDSAQKLSLKTGKPIILFFTGQWCVPCRIMKRRVWADDDVSELVNTHFIPVSVELSAPENAELAARYKVEGTPVTIITNEHGDALGWRAGGIDKPEFLELLRECNPSEIGLQVGTSPTIGQLSK